MSAQVYKSHGHGFKFNDLVVAEMVFAPDEKRVGRLVQVRKGTGPFGMDGYFLRLHDGTLMYLANVQLRHYDDWDFVDAFYKANGRTPPKVHPVEEYHCDEPDIEYTQDHKFPETGFIIEKPSQPAHPQQSFAMTITSDKPLK